MPTLLPDQVSAAGAPDRSPVAPISRPDELRSHVGDRYIEGFMDLLMNLVILMVRHARNGTHPHQALLVCVAIGRVAVPMLFEPHLGSHLQHVSSASLLFAAQWSSFGADARSHPAVPHGRTR
ncbi:hypothetical protein WI38_26700 [Burkholderia ubonensis]|uniref:Uncharacterized protein n=2 Tax=Burkholderia ubonensis TaxID=101571 RepID=A0A102LPH4_9BURK|nr:hypothetical protein [Burkholderia ubonensis]KUZ71742.1 hypothetical protein WI35_12735 [Burkholderia ubonensis]KUZ83873.1 hypothetical protein WI38_26700 [Burkholderia ubonensis]KUZ97489.1 hypothetical protein WI39_08930 [Burkholderia ubonensis]